MHLVEPAPKVAVPILLRKLREAAGMSQVDVAARLGVSYQAAQKWERPGANPTVATIERVLKVFRRRLGVEVIACGPLPFSTQHYIQWSNAQSRKGKSSAEQSADAVPRSKVPPFASRLNPKSQP